MINKEYLIEITKQLYNLTLLFPKKEPLRYKMRELSNDILACNTWKLSRSDYLDNFQVSVAVINELEALDALFEVAKAQNWVKQEEILNLQQKYSKIKQSIKALEQEVIESKQEIPEAKQEIPEPAKAPEITEYPIPDVGYSQTGLNKRQDRIVAFLKDQGRAQVKDLQEILPQVTKRTLRRDFQALLNREIVERIGQRNETYYQLKVKDSSS
jgi:DNA-binding transcriptional ArsR family regulator